MFFISSCNVYLSSCLIVSPDNHYFVPVSRILSRSWHPAVSLHNSVRARFRVKHINLPSSFIDAINKTSLIFFLSHVPRVSDLFLLLFALKHRLSCPELLVFSFFSNLLFYNSLLFIWSEYLKTLIQHFLFFSFFIQSLNDLNNVVDKFLNSESFFWVMDQNAL